MWVERPARLFQRLLAETIRAKGGQLVIENDSGTSGPKLSGRLLDMGYDVRAASVVVRFDAVKQAGGRIETRRFESVVPVKEAAAKYVGPALNEAANSVAQAVADWVKP
jgi:cholesterol transport system auxiliary component